MLTRVREVEIKEVSVIDLIEQIIFRPVTANETIEYGLSALFKLYDKFANEHKERILKMIKSFESHSDLEVQKRACEYSKLLDQSWREERVKEICIPIPPMRAAADTFGLIPVGETTMDLDSESLKMPEKLNINYDDHIATVKAGEQREFREGDKYAQPQQQQNSISNANKTGANQSITGTGAQQQQKGSSIIDITGSSSQSQTQQQPQNKKTKSLLDDDDDVPPATQNLQQQQQNANKQLFTQSPATTISNAGNTANINNKAADPFDILGLDLGGGQQAAKQSVSSVGGSGGVDLMGLSFNTPPGPGPQQQQPQQPSNKGFGSLLDDGLLRTGSSGSTNQQYQPTINTNTFSQPQQSLGFDFLGTGSSSTSATTTTAPVSLFQQQQTLPATTAMTQNSHKFKAY